MDPLKLNKKGNLHELNMPHSFDKLKFKKKREEIWQRREHFLNFKAAVIYMSTSSIEIMAVFFKEISSP